MNEIRNKLLLDMAIEGFWDWDLTTDRAYLSPRYCEMSGYSPDDTVFDSNFLRMIIHPEDHERAFTTIAEHLQGKLDNSVIEYRMISKDGTVRWIEGKGKIAAYDEHGTPVRMVGTIVDISERKEFEQKLRLSEEKFATAFRSSPDSININRLSDGMYLEINEGFTSLTGYTPEDVIGRTSHELNIWVNPHDRTRLVTKLTESGIANNLEADFRLKDGSIQTGLMSARIIEIEGEPCILSITRDISERKQVEDEIRRDKALLRCIIDSVSDLIFVKDADSVYLTCNKASEEFVGLPECEQIGRTDFDFFSRDVAEVIREYDRQIMFSGKERCIVEWADCSDGSRRLLDTLKTPFYGPDGKLLGLVGISRDITERKQAEEAVINSNKLLQTIVNTVPMRVFWKDTELRYLGCNLAFAKDAGFAKPDDIIGKSDYQMGWSEQAELYRADDRRVIESGIPILSFDEQQTTPEGNRIWLRTSKIPLRNEADETTGVVGIYEDITEHKLSEITKTRLLLRQRAILDNLPMMAWLKDTESRLEMVNEPYARSCGRSVEECIGKTDLELYPLEMARGFMADDREVCASGLKKQLEEPISTPDGIKWHLTFKTPLFDERGVVSGSTGIAQDITEQKQVEVELKKKNAEIEQFLYTVSHDLRSPLVTVKTFLGFLENDMAAGNPERVAQDIQFIHSAADKMKLLLDELLEMTRIDRVETQPVRVSLMEVVADALNALAGVISERKVVIRFPDTDRTVLADRQRFCQIWQNLIENAIKYSPLNSPPQIELGGQLMDGEVVFFVKDKGIGIDPQYHSKVFGIFEKLDPKSSGAGLGLSMIQRIVEKGGGRVWVESEGLGKGACFYFTLPHTEV